MVVPARWFRGWILVAIGLTGPLVGVAPAGSVPIRPPTYSATPLDTVNVKGTVYATTIIGSRVYVGGAFEKVRHRGVDFAYPNLVAFDLATGALIESFRPNPNGEVRSLATEGTSIYVGGRFTTIGGQRRARLARLDASSGALKPAFVASVNARVDAIVFGAGRVFFSGRYTEVNGVRRRGLASVDGTTGALSDWDPAVVGGVAALELSTNARTLYVGGGFTSIAGSSRSRLAAVSTRTTTVVGRDFVGAIENVKSMALSDDDLSLFVGDVGNDLEAYDTVVGSRRWQNTSALGDVQATHFGVDGYVYAGFHDGAGGLTDARVLAIDPDSGLTVNWHPRFASSAGIFTIASSSSRLVVGGDFWSVSGVAQDGLALFPVRR